MEFPTIDNSATLANSELLARLKNNRLPTSIDIPTHRIDVSCSDEPDDELVEAVPVPVPPQPVAVPAPPDGLKTPAQAARRLNISVRTLRGLIKSGELRYVNLGHGKQREKIMFTDSYLDDLIASRTRQKVQECPSTSPKARRTTTSTSSGEVLAFTARRNGRTGAKRKR
jgi:excisionase family DNA binding protein